LGDADGRGGPGGVSYGVVVFRLHPLLLLALIVVVCAGLIVGVAALTARRAATTGDLLTYLPSVDGVTLAIDMATLRQSGALVALAGARVAEEPEYQAFVTETGFNYQQDLDLVMARFGKDTSYFLLRGRFDWPRLGGYVRSQGGACRNSYCRVGGSTPERQISFFPLKTNIMAMAVGPSADAAWQLAYPQPKPRPETAPARPVWLTISPGVLQNVQNLHPGARLLAAALEGAGEIELSLEIASDRLEALLDVVCRTPGEAAVLSSQLEQVTRMLKATSAPGGAAANPRDLVGVLSGGSYRSQGQHVLGRWPLERAFLESILGSSQ
jgi:hypothetical protein